MTRTLAVFVLLMLAGCALAPAPAPAPTKFERCMAAVIGQSTYAADRLRVAEWCANYERAAP
jgi:hypothetical protein